MAFEKQIKAAKNVAQRPVFGFQLWEVAAVLGLGYLGYKSFTGAHATKAEGDQTAKMATDLPTRQAMTLYSAMVPGLGPTNSDLVLSTSTQINDITGVKNAYFNLYARQLATDLAKYLSSADVATFGQNVANANVNQGNMDINAEAAKFYAILHSVVPVNDAQYVQLMNLANDIQNSGADSPQSVYNNIVTAYKAKYGADMDVDIENFWKAYNPGFEDEHSAYFQAVMVGDVYSSPPSGFKSPYTDQYGNSMNNIPSDN